MLHVHSRNCDDVALHSYSEYFESIAHGVLFEIDFICFFVMISCADTSTDEHTAHTIQNSDTYVRPNN